jgi:alanine racemase
MDQFVVDLGLHSTAKAGDEVEVFGADPAADQWGTWSDSIGYEIVTRIGTRVPRVHVRDGKVLRDNEHHGA